MASKDEDLAYEEITAYADGNGREYVLELGSDGELYRKPRRGGRRRQLTLGQAKLDLTEAGAQGAIDSLGKFLADKTLTSADPVATVVAASKLDAELSDGIDGGELNGQDGSGEENGQDGRGEDYHMSDDGKHGVEMTDGMSGSPQGMVAGQDSQGGSQNPSAAYESAPRGDVAPQETGHDRDGNAGAADGNSLSQPVSATPEGTAAPLPKPSGAPVPPYGSRPTQAAPSPDPRYRQRVTPPSNAPVPPAGTTVPPSAFTVPAPVANPTGRTPKRHGSGVTAKAALAGALSGAVIVLAGLGIGFGTGALRTGGATGTQATTGGSVLNVSKDAVDDGDGTLAEQVAQKVIPSVASITVTTTDTSMSSLLSGASGTTATGVGSGSVLDAQGHILTNYHVVQDAKTISVSLNGKEYENATVVGYDESSDLAVIKIDPGSDTLVPIEISDSDDVKVGQWVMSVGSPFGNEQSVSTGIVSSLYRNMALPSETGTSIYANMIQTDAAINPGNSGGALVNRDGKLIGVNSIIESSSGSSSGVGFAIPSTYATSVAQQIIDGKTVEHPAIGATVSTVSGSAARNAGASDGGALVQSVTEGGAAASAGLQKGDVITKVDDDDITGADALIIAIRAHAVGDKVRMTYVRNGQASTTEVTLGSDAGISKGQEDKSDDSNALQNGGDGSGTNGNASDGTSSGNAADGSSEDAEQRFQDFVDRLRNGRRNG